jgi:hypothetical protein
MLCTRRNRLSNREVLMKPTVSSIVCLAILAFPSAPVPGADKDKDSLPPELSSPYYPLKIGTQWEYQVGPTVVSMRVVKHEKVGDAMCALIETYVDGNRVPVASEHISAGPDGVFRHSFNTARASEPICILKLPVKKDQTWKFDAKIATETVKGTFKCGEEDVKVPAGNYKKAVSSYTTECDLNGAKAEFKYWFAPGVGVVRQTMTIGGRDIESKLVKFEAGK